MEFRDVNEIISDLDMDEQQLVLTSLFYTLGVSGVYEIVIKTASFLRENNRDEASGILEKAAGKMAL